MTSGKRNRTVVTNNKALARAVIRDVLDAKLRHETNGEGANASDAVQEIEALSPEIFLNHEPELPDTGGRENLESLDREALRVIFVMVDVRALDHLLHPVHRKRFRRSSSRVNHTGLDQARTRKENILQVVEGAEDPQYIQRLVIKAEGRIFLLDVEDIHYVQAEGNYVAVHNGQRAYLLRETISGLEARLDPRKFLRVHRSAIVKIEKIKELQPWFHGEFRIILDGGKQLMLSRNYRARFQNAIGNAL